jgi:hypothetical protein
LTYFAEVGKLASYETRASSPSRTSTRRRARQLTGEAIPLSEADDGGLERDCMGVAAATDLEARGA